MNSIGEGTDFVRKVENALVRSGVGPFSSVLVGVSAGADSTALLGALTEVSRFHLQLVAMHVDHGLRPERERGADAEFLGFVCGRLGVKLAIGRIEEGEIEERARRESRSLEEVAREMRYGLLSSFRAEHGLEWIAVAHTLDDQLETILMRLFQGGFLQGMSGIPWKRGRIIRPVLSCSRDEILAFLKSRRLRYRRDSTNTNERFLRNRVRNQLVPAVRRVFPDALSAIEAFSGRLSNLNDLLDACTTSMINWERTEDGYRVSAGEFFAAPDELRVRSVLRLFNESGVAGRIPRRFLKAIEGPEPKRVSSPILRGHGVVVELVGGFLFWRTDVVAIPKKSYLVRVFGPNMYHITPSLCLTVGTMPNRRAGGHGIGLPESLVRHPLVVRSRRPGDTIQAKGGRKSLKKLFNEWGVSADLRDSVPVIEDRGGIWAVVGSAVGYEDRVRDHSIIGGKVDLTGREIVFAFEHCGDQR